MNALVVYDSRFGNTEKVARAIGEALSENGAAGRVVPAGDVADPSAEGLGLLAVGGPTQAHGASPALRATLGGLHRGRLRGVRAATFDTRLRMTRLLSGSAARAIAKWLRRAGCRLVVRPESFFVGGREGQLEIGEEDRAREWARGLVPAMEVRR